MGAPRLVIDRLEKVVDLVTPLLEVGGTGGSFDRPVSFDGVAERVVDGDHQSAPSGQVAWCGR